MPARLRARVALRGWWGRKRPLTGKCAHKYKQPRQAPFAQWQTHRLESSGVIKGPSHRIAHLSPKELLGNVSKGLAAAREETKNERIDWALAPQWCVF